MPLSDTAIKNAKPTPDKAYKLQDEKGMYLPVNPNGSKYFRYNYRFNGKRKTLALGIYPVTSLKEAREKRDTAKKQIDGGIDPNENKKAVKQSKAESAANSFEVIAREWYERNMSDKSESHKKRSMRLMATDLFPHIGVKPITDMLIAATAMNYNLELYTLNTKDFKFIPNMRLYSAGEYRYFRPWADHTGTAITRWPSVAWM